MNAAETVVWACRQCGGRQWGIVSIGYVVRAVCESCNADRRFTVSSREMAPFDIQQGKSA